LVLDVGGVLDTYGAKTPNADIIRDLMIWTLEVNKAEDVSRILLTSFALLAPYSGDLIRLIRWQPQRADKIEIEIEMEIE
jgi:hypothetical protein